MKIAKSISLILLVAMSCNLLVAQDEDMMKAWMEMITPGEEHKEMADMVGDWTYEMEFWMAPGAEPQQTKGTTSYTMIMGGRYLKGVHKSQMMGMPFEGMDLTAYDNVAQKYYGTWIDNMGTGIMYFEGEMDGDKMVMQTQYDNPFTKSTETHKVITQWIDENNHEMEYWVVPEDGEPYKSMHTKYTRQ